MSVWVLPSLFAVAVLLGFIGYVLSNRPPEPMRPAVLGGLFASLLFAIGDALTYVQPMTGPEAVQPWPPVALLYTGLIFVPPAWWLLSHRFAQACGQPMKCSTSIWVYTPLVLAGLIWLGMITNPWHGQFIRLIVNGRNDYQWLWWVHMITSYTVVVAALCVYTLLVLKVKEKERRRRVLLMLLAPLLTFFGNMLYVLPSEPMPVDATPILLSIAGALFLIGVYRIGFFSLSPMAMATIIAHQPNGIVVTDVDGSVLHWNSAAEQALEQPLSDVHSSIYNWLSEHLQDSDCQPVSDQDLRQALEGPPTIAPGSLFRLRCDRDRWVNLRVAAVRSRSDQVVGYSFLVEDRTEAQSQEAERARLYEQMSESQKLESLGVLAGGIAHDFNNLLMAIRGNIELALAGNALNPSLYSQLMSIQEASDRAARLTKQLLDYAGTARTDTRTMNLSELVRATSDLLRTAVLPQGLTLQLELDQDVWMNGDQTQIEQILMNLTINSAEAYAGASGRVTIETGETEIDAEYLSHCLHDGQAQPGHYVYVEVRDAGPGMPDETVSRMFDPFYTTKGSGRGLGLAAVLGIVRNHQGALRVDTATGSGTGIRALFPREKRPAQPDVRIGAPVHQEDNEDKTVLVVDDEDAVRTVICRLLEFAGMTTIAADGGNEALELLAQEDNRVDMVLLDVAMPGMDGFASLDGVRRLCPDLPVVFMSGHPEEDLAVRLREENRVYFVMKPFTESEILAKIQEAS